MDHIVYVDAKENDLEKLLNGKKTMIVRGAAGRKLPFGRVEAGDHLYFTLNNGKGLLRACAPVLQVENLGPLSEELANKILDQHQAQLNLAPAQRKRWQGKRFLVLISIGVAQPLDAFPFDRSGYGNMDDWLPVGNILSVKR